jgi:hypothetical protein
MTAQHRSKAQYYKEGTAAHAPLEYPHCPPQIVTTGATPFSTRISTPFFSPFSIIPLGLIFFLSNITYRFSVVVIGQISCHPSCR